MGHLPNPSITRPAHKNPRKSSDIKRQRIISSLTSGAITSSLKRIEQAGIQETQGKIL
jgi:hypothetical protein